MSAPALWPVYEFRPPLAHAGLLRYAGGDWIPDDGEHDLSFICTRGAPVVYYVDLPHQRNILWAWTSAHWSRDEWRHRDGNPWHYMLRDGETAWGGPWERGAHENVIAGARGMDKCAALYRCANGRVVRFELADPYIAGGLLRERETKEVVVPPADPLCMYCGRGAAVYRGRAEEGVFVPGGFPSLAQPCAEKEAP